MVALTLALLSVEAEVVVVSNLEDVRSLFGKIGVCFFSLCCEWWLFTVTVTVVVVVKVGTNDITVAVQLTASSNNNSSSRSINERGGILLVNFVDSLKSISDRV